MAIGTVEAYIGNGGYGGDFALDANADLLLISDAPGNPAATAQRLLRLMLTSPVGYDTNGVAIRDPGDISNPTWGGNLPSTVGENESSSLTHYITAQIVAAATADIGVASSPAPTVSVVYQGAEIIATLTVTCVTGDVITLSQSIGG